jgi:hypothetical protein
MKLEFSGEIFENCLNIKFHENPASGIRVAQCGHTDTDRQTMKNVIFDFPNFTKAAKNKANK